VRVRQSEQSSPRLAILFSFRNVLADSQRFFSRAVIAFLGSKPTASARSSSSTTYARSTRYVHSRI